MARCIVEDLQRNNALSPYNLQVTLDGSNFDLSKFLISRGLVTAPIFFFILLLVSEFTLDLSNSWSLKTLDLSK